MALSLSPLTKVNLNKKRECGEKLPTAMSVAECRVSMLDSRP